MRVHSCGERFCRKTIPIEYRYCEQHFKEHHQKFLESNRQYRDKNKEQRMLKAKRYDEFERDKERTKFYHSSSWTRVSIFVKNRDYYTDAVTGNVIPDRECIVDHIIPMRLCDDLQAKLDTDNLWLLSQRNHNIKTKKEQSMTDNQLKHVGKDWWIKVIKDELNRKQKMKQKK